MGNNQNSIFWVVWGAITVALIWLVTTIIELIMRPIFAITGAAVGKAIGVSVRSVGRAVESSNRPRKLTEEDYELAEPLDYRAALFNKYAENAPVIVFGKVETVNRNSNSAVITATDHAEGESFGFAVLEFDEEPEILENDVLKIFGRLDRIAEPESDIRAPVIRVEYFYVLS